MKKEKITKQNVLLTIVPVALVVVGVVVVVVMLIRPSVKSAADADNDTDNDAAAAAAAAAAKTAADMKASVAAKPPAVAQPSVTQSALNGPSPSMPANPLEEFDELPFAVDDTYMIRVVASSSPIAHRGTAQEADDAVTSALSDSGSILPADSEASAAACLKACLRWADGNGASVRIIDAASLAAPLPGVAKACDCFENDASHCTNTLRTKYGTAASFVRKTKSGKCVKYSTLSSSHQTAATSGCQTKRGYYKSSCHADAQEIPCRPCASPHLFRARCGGTSAGECVARRQCKGDEKPVNATNPFQNTTCRRLRCREGSEVSESGVCRKCRAGMSRRRRKMFKTQKDRFKVVYDVASRSPKYSSTKGNEIGHLEVVEVAELVDVLSPSSSSAAIELVPSIHFPHIFSLPNDIDVKNLTIDSVLFARVPLGTLSSGGYFSQIGSNSELAKIYFANATMPSRCV